MIRKLKKRYWFDVTDGYSLRGSSFVDPYTGLPIDASVAAAADEAMYIVQDPPVSYAKARFIHSARGAYHVSRGNVNIAALARTGTRKSRR